MTEQASRLNAPLERLDLDETLPLTAAIMDFLAHSGLAKAELVRRLGYVSTVPKGLRRLDALLQGELKYFEALKARLAAALGMSADALARLAGETHTALQAQADREYRDAFVPHVIWDTTLRIPSPITIAGMIGAQRHLYFNPRGIDPATWSDEAAQACPLGIPCYGRVTGFWVNYSPDCAVHFSRDGEPTEVLAAAVRRGAAVALIGTRPLTTSEELQLEPPRPDNRNGVLH